jgi:hypothetical protein
MAALKDLGSSGMQMRVSEGAVGETRNSPRKEQGATSLD